MAGDTFDAGTVVAEARLDRDELRRDIQATKRELQQFQRDAAKMVARPKVQPIGLVKAQNQITRLLRDFRELSRYVARPRVEIAGGAAALAETRRINDELDRLSRRTATATLRINSSGGATSVLSVFAGFATMLPKSAAAAGLFSVAMAGVVSVLQLAATASGGLAVLPAMLASGAAVAATLKVGLMGVGDALKAAAEGDAEKLAEAMAKLAPNARAFVTEIQRLTPAWKSMQLDVQQRLFAGLAGTVAALSTAYLPMLHAEMTELGMDLNDVATSLGQFLLRAQSVSDVEAIFDSTQMAVRNLTPALSSILQILFDVAAVGSTLLPDMAAGFAGWAEGAAASVRAMRESGELLTMMERGLQTIYSLGGMIDSIFGIIGGVMRAARMDGEGMAITLATVFQRWENWVNSAAGQNVLIEFFTHAKALASELAPVLGGIAAAAGSFVMAILPALPPFVAGIGAVLEVAGPLLGTFTQLAAIVLPAVGAALGLLAPILGPLLVMIGAAISLFKVYRATVILIAAVTKGWAVAQALLNGALALNPIGLVVVALVALAAALVYAWNNSETFRNIVMAAWQGIQTAAAAAWGFLQTVFAAIGTAVQAVGQAAVWLWQNVMVPAWNGIVAAIQAAGAVFTWLWVNAIQPAFNFISTAARVLLAVLVTAVLAPIVLAVKAAGAVFTWLWENAVKPAWEAISTFVSTAWNGVIKPVFDAIVGFIQGAFTVAWNWLRDTAVGVWQAVSDFISMVWNSVILPVWDAIVTYLGGFFVQAFEGWKIVVLAVWDAVSSGIETAWNFIRDNIWNPIVSFLSATLGPAFEVARDLIVGAWNAIQSGIETVWNFVRDNIFNPIVDFVTGTIPGAFNTAVDGIRTAWEKIREIVAAPVRFMVGVVYNEGIVPAWNWIADLVGLGKLTPVNLGFHEGGIVPGPSGTYRDNTLARVNGGEAIMRPEWTRAMGPRYVEEMNRLAANGGPRAIKRALNSGAIVEGADHNGPGSSTVGFGGVRPHVAQAGHYLKNRFGISTVGGVGQRANASDHPKGLALDFMTYNDVGKGNALTDFLSSAANWQHFAVKYIIWRQRIASSPGAWRGMADRGSPTANHMDHPHVSFLGGPGSGPMDGGGGFLAKLTEMWAKVLGFMGRVNEFMGTMWGEGAMGLLKNLVDGAWNYLLGKATGGLMGGTNPGAAQLNAGNMYDQGGLIPTGTSVVHNRTGRPELAGRLDQWASLIDSARVSHPGAGNLNAPDASLEKLNATMIEIRDMLERRGAGATINVDDRSGSPVETARAAALQLRLS